jgi:hypothetical protein
MLETPHVAVGAAIAATVPNPLLAIPLCLASHFILDKIPHWNPHTFTETQKYGYPKKQTFAIAIFDITTATLLGFSLAYLALPNTNQALLILACCFVSVLPDVIKYPYFVFKWARKGLMEKYVLWERKLQEDAPLIPGILTQAATIIISLLIFFKLN